MSEKITGTPIGSRLVVKADKKAAPTRDELETADPKPEKALGVLGGNTHPKKGTDETDESKIS